MRRSRPQCSPCASKLVVVAESFSISSQLATPCVFERHTHVVPSRTSHRGGGGWIAQWTATKKKWKKKPPRQLTDEAACLLLSPRDHDVVVVVLVVVKERGGAHHHHHHHHQQHYHHDHISKRQNKRIAYGQSATTATTRQSHASRWLSPLLFSSLSQAPGQPQLHRGGGGGGGG